MLSDVEKGNNPMLTRLPPVATLVYALRSYSEPYHVLFQALLETSPCWKLHLSESDVFHSVNKSLAGPGIYHVTFAVSFEASVNACRWAKGNF